VGGHRAAEGGDQQDMFLIQCEVEEVVRAFLAPPLPVRMVTFSHTATHPANGFGVPAERRVGLVERFLVERSCRPDRAETAASQFADESVFPSDNFASLKLFGEFFGVVVEDTLGELDGWRPAAEFVIFSRCSTTRRKEQPSGEHLEEGAAQAPHIHFYTKRRADDGFRRKVFPGAEGATLVESFSGASEVGKPCVSGARIVENIVGFYVGVRESTAVQTLERHEDLLCHTADSLDGQRAVLERGFEAASVFLEGHADMAVMEEGFMQRDYFRTWTALPQEAVDVDLSSRRSGVAAALDFQGNNWGVTHLLFTKARRIS
jgi:hypothetical protein